jgi:hypothetical protein
VHPAAIACLQEGEGTLSCREGAVLLAPVAGLSVRKHNRLTLDLPAAVKTAAGQTGHKTFLLRTVDVSAGGALFRSEHGLTVGMNVSVVLFLRPNPRETHRYLRIAFHGTVVRSGPGRFAVAFAEPGQTAGRQKEMASPEQLAPENACSTLKRPERERI